MLSYNQEPCQGSQVLLHNLCSKLKCQTSSCAVEVKNIHKHMLARASINCLYIDTCKEVLTSCKSTHAHKHHTVLHYLSFQTSKQPREILPDNHKTKYCKEQGYHIQYSQPNIAFTNPLQLTQAILRFQILKKPS